MEMLNMLKKGIFSENPAFRLVLGMCPTLAVTTSAINGIGMGVSTTAVLLGSNIVISSLRNVIPQKVRIPSYITIIAGFVTIIQMLLKAYLPALNDALGIFIPLIVVNCIILSRAESFASKNSVPRSAMDGLAMGLGFTLALFALGGIREILGNASLFGFALFGESAKPSLAILMPPGGFLTLGLLIGLIQKASSIQIKPNSCGSCGGRAVARA
jgi:Na+-translocating ferredoxin:NAD+ oxidoreductase subunit E